MNVNVVFQIPGLANLVGHVNQPAQRSRDPSGGPVGNDHAQTQSGQGTEHRGQNRSRRGQFIGVAPLIEQFAILPVDIVQHLARTRDPGVRILLQIENL